MKHRKQNQLIFGIYCLVMLRLLFGRHRFDKVLSYRQEIAYHTNLEPFHTFKLYWRHLSGSSRGFWYWHSVVNSLGNIALFVPLGFLLPAVFPRLNRFWKTMLLALLIICTVEVLQVLLLVGYCDIDDLILNLMGTAVGYGLYKLSPFAKACR